VGFFPTFRKCHYLKCTRFLLAFACFFYLKPSSVLLPKKVRKWQKNLPQPSSAACRCTALPLSYFWSPFYDTNLTIKHFHPALCRTHQTMLLSLKASVQGATEDGTFVLCCSDRSGSVPTLWHTQAIALGHVSHCLHSPHHQQTEGQTLEVKTHHLISSLNLSNLRYLGLSFFLLEYQSALLLSQMRFPRRLNHTCASSPNPFPPEGRTHLPRPHSFPWEKQFYASMIPRARNSSNTSFCP